MDSVSTSIFLVKANVSGHDNNAEECLSLDK